MAWAYPARAPLPARQCGDSFRHWPASARGVAVHCSEADHRKQRRTAHPWSDLHSRVHVTIRARNLFTREQAVLLAVSGGQDSVCMAKLLIDMTRLYGFRLAVAHCNHRWRPDAGANAEAVQHFADQHGLQCHVRAAEQPPASEAAARAWRYGQLAELAAAEGFSAVVTGHTATDRAETLLLNLARGSGTQGLQPLRWRRDLVFTETGDIGGGGGSGGATASIAAEAAAGRAAQLGTDTSTLGSDDNDDNADIAQSAPSQPSSSSSSQGQGMKQRIQLVRPLLEVTRAETAAFCAAQGLSVFHDTTNDNLKLRRNVVRLKLLPLLSQELNPQAELALARTAELLQADHECLERAAAAALQQARQGAPPGDATALSRRALAALPVALQRRAVRQHIASLAAAAAAAAAAAGSSAAAAGGSAAHQRKWEQREALKFQNVEKVVALVNAPNRTQTDPLPGLGLAVVEGAWIRFVPP